MASYSVEEILNERIDYSSYSAEESFTLSDILAERDAVDEELLREEEIIEDGMFDDCFEDDSPGELDLKEETTEVNLTDYGKENPKGALDASNEQIPRK